VDTTKDAPTLLSFCTGYGGLERGIERVIGAVRVLAHVEIEAYAIANLVDKMETGQLVPAPVWTNVKTFPVELFRDRVDILTAGYPCQPFSAAGARQGSEDPRHLWPSIRRAIKSIRPAMCFFENVEGHISLGLSTVLSDLEEDGYRTTWGIFSAAEVGAPHQRKRVFILAYNQYRRCSENGEYGSVEGVRRRPEDLSGKTAEPSSCMAHSNNPGQRESGGGQASTNGTAYR